MFLLRAPGDVDDRVIPQVLSHAREVVDHGDIETAQLVLRPDARKQQEMRGSNSARTQDNFLACDGKLLSTALHLDTNGFFAVEDDAVHHTVGPE